MQFLITLAIVVYFAKQGPSGSTFVKGYQHSQTEYVTEQKHHLLRHERKLVPRERTEPKVDICHWSEDTQSYVLISIGSSAVKAHINGHDKDMYPAHFYIDADGDGAGYKFADTSDPTQHYFGCPMPGFAPNQNDCNDYDSTTLVCTVPICRRDDTTTGDVSQSSPILWYDVDVDPSDINMDEDFPFSCNEVQEAEFCAKCPPLTSACNDLSCLVEDAIPDAGHTAIYCNSIPRSCPLPEDGNPMEITSYCDLNLDLCITECIHESTNCYDGGHGDGVCRRCVDYCPQLSMNIQIRFDAVPKLSLSQAAMDARGINENDVIASMNAAYPELFGLSGQQCSITIYELDDIIGSNEYGHPPEDVNTTVTHDYVRNCDTGVSEHKSTGTFERSFRVYSPRRSKLGYKGYKLSSTCNPGAEFLKSFTETRQARDDLNGDGRVDQFGTTYNFFEIKTNAIYKDEVGATDPFDGGEPWKKNLELDFNVGPFVVASFGSGGPGTGGEGGDEPWWLPSSGRLTLDLIDPAETANDGPYIDLIHTPSVTWIPHEDVTEMCDFLDHHPAGYIKGTSISWRAKIGHDTDGLVSSEIFENNYVEFNAKVESVDFINDGLMPCHFSEDDFCDKLCFECGDSRCQDIGDSCFRPECVTPLMDHSGSCESTNTTYGHCIDNFVDLRDSFNHMRDHQVLALCGDTAIDVPYSLNIGAHANNITLCCAGPPGSCILRHVPPQESWILKVANGGSRVEGIAFKDSPDRGLEILAIEDTGNFALVNCSFYNNTDWSYGAGLKAGGGTSLAISGSNFTFNKPYKDETWPDGYGGGAAALYLFDELLVSDCRVEKNEGVSRTGGLYIANVEAATVQNSIFNDNYVHNGRAAALYSDVYEFHTLTLKNNQGSGNEANSNDRFQCADAYLSGYGLEPEPNGCYFINGTFESYYGSGG